MLPYGVTSHFKGLGERKGGRLDNFKNTHSGVENANTPVVFAFFWVPFFEYWCYHTHAAWIKMTISFGRVAEDALQSYRQYALWTPLVYCPCRDSCFFFTFQWPFLLLRDWVGEHKLRCLRLLLETLFLLMVVHRLQAVLRSIPSIFRRLTVVRFVWDLLSMDQTPELCFQYPCLLYKIISEYGHSHQTTWHHNHVYKRNIVEKLSGFNLNVFFLQKNSENLVYDMIPVFRECPCVSYQNL